jgi:3-oxoacyl-[acyl-carrier-protein] synthase-3
MEDGPTVFFTAIDGFVELAKTCLAELEMTIDDVDLLVPHQPNVRILERVARMLGLPREKMVVCVEETGNVGGASAGIALVRARERGLLRPGARVLLLTAGAGYAMAAVVLEVVEE